MNTSDFHALLEEVGLSFLKGFVESYKSMVGKLRGVDWERLSRKMKRREKYLRRYERRGRQMRKK